MRGGFDSGRSFLATRLNQLQRRKLAIRLNQLQGRKLAIRLNQLQGGEFAARLNQLRGGEFAARLNRLRGGEFAIRLDQLQGGGVRDPARPALGKGCSQLGLTSFKEGELVESACERQRAGRVETILRVPGESWAVWPGRSI